MSQVVQDSEDRRGFAVYVVVRLVALAYAVIANVVRLHTAAFPGLTLLACAVLVAWTFFALYIYGSPRRRTWPAMIADLAVGVAFVAASPVVLGAAYQDRITLGTFWLIAAPLAIAIWKSWWKGVIAAAGLALLEVVLVPGFDLRFLGMKAALAVLTGAVGYLVASTSQAYSHSDRMAAQAAALAERQRLARAVHDGVLQVLAMVEREGPALGPRGARLARAAAEQEAALRALLQDSVLDGGGDETHRDLASLLDRHAGPGVTISTPAGSVVLDSHRAEEIDAAVAEALTNVRRHAGPDAQAWVLLEREDDELLISIRDNGVGGTREQFDSATRRGRLGMKHSIQGRMRDLGGEAVLRTAPGRGVEWEFRLPVE